MFQDFDGNVKNCKRIGIGGMPYRTKPAPMKAVVYDLTMGNRAVMRVWFMTGLTKSFKNEDRIT
jgi:hypothetical protein